MSHGSTIEIEYPVSDGLPMGESDEHIRWLVRVYDLLEHRYRNADDLYLGRNMFLYYEEGNPRRHLVPDVFLVHGVPRGSRETFKTWIEGRVPNVVFEVASKTRRRDKIEKPGMYSAIGVPEYFMYDHTGTFLDDPLMGYRLVDGGYVPIEPDTDGRLHSEELGVLLERDDIGELVMRDAVSGEVLRTALEEALSAREADRLAAESRLEAAEARLEAERTAAEAELRARDAEIERLRQLLDESGNDGSDE